MKDHHMSNIEMNAPTNHNVTSYPVVLFTDSTKALPGHRLVVMRWKDGKSEKALSPTRAVSIPRFTDLTVTPVSLQIALTAAYEELQDARIKELVEEDLRANLANPKVNPIHQKDITPEAIASWSIEQATSDRLSKDKLTEWFDTSLKDELAISLLRAKGYDLTATDVGEVPGLVLTATDKSVQNYREALSKLAAPTIKYPEPLVIQLKRAINLSSDNTMIARLNTRLDAMLKADNSFSLDDLS